MRDVRVGTALRVFAHPALAVIVVRIDRRSMREASEAELPQRRKTGMSGTATIAGAVAISVSLISPLTRSAAEPKKQYWPTGPTGGKSATFRDHALRIHSVA